MTDPKPAKPAAAKPATARATAAKPATAKATAAKPKPVVPPIEATPVTTAATAPAGWYPVAAGSTQQRWWDGNAWTEHVHDSAAAQSATVAQVAALRAPEGTSPATVWIWLTAVSPVIAIVSYVFLSTYLTRFASLDEDTATGFSQIYSDPAYLLDTAISFVALIAAILFPILDWRVLTKRGVPKPFHWAWSLAAIVISSPIIYVIGRTVVVKRRTGKGLAPMWVFIPLQVVTWIFGLIVIVVFFVALFSQIANLATDAVY